MADSEALKARGLQGHPERRMASLSSSDMDLHMSSYQHVWKMLLHACLVACCDIVVLGVCTSVITDN